VTLCEATHHGHKGFGTPLIDGEALHTTLSELAPAQGRNDVALWPGLTIRRFCTSGRLHRAESDTLSFGFVAPARDAIVHVGGRSISRHPVYMVTSGGSNVDIEITAASVRHPVFYGEVPIDAQLVRSMSAAMYPLRVTGGRDELSDAPSVSTLDDQLMQAALGFLASLSSGCDRRVLAPLRMTEVVYRLLQRGQRTRLLRLAAEELQRNPVAAALSHISDHLAQPLSVEALAVRVNMSPSAFSRTFREATGRPPYQYIKDARLDRARILLEERRLGVSAVAAAVGYGSVSHFIKEFHRRYGSTPGEYSTSVIVH
jgi:AraC-like DNA-binding protein